MAQYVQRFGGRQRGLEVTTGNKTQSGLLEAENVDLEREGVARKRPGSVQVSLSRSTDPTDLIPTDTLTALYSRESELLLEARNTVYARQQCGLAGGGSAGTATPLEISNAIADMETRRNPVRVIDVPLPGYAVASNVRTRLNRPDVDPDVVITPSGRTITFSVLPNRTAVQVTEPGEPTQLAPLAGIQHRIIRMVERDFGVRKMPPPLEDFDAEQPVVIVTWLAKATTGSTFATLRHMVINVAEIFVPTVPDLTIIPQTTNLGIVQGPADVSSYETAPGVFIAFEAVGSDVRAYEIDNPLNSLGYTLSNPPSAESGYACDVSANLFPADANGFAITWASASDLVQHAAQLSPTTSTVVSERSRVGLPVGTGLQVGIADGPGITWGLGDAAGAFGVAPGYLDRPVSVFDPTIADIRFAEFDGSDLRVVFQLDGAGLPVYTFRKATTDAAAYDQQSVLGMTDATDPQYALQADTIYGILTSTLDGLREIRWRRTADIVANGIGLPSVTRAALATSATRLTATFWIADTTLGVRRFTDIDTGGTVAVFTPITEAVGALGSVLGSGILAEPGPDQVDMVVHTMLDASRVLTVATDGVGVTVTLTRVDTLPQAPLFIESTPAGTPPRTMMSVSYPSEAIEVFEVNTNLFVRVSPVSSVRSGGDWVARGPWTRTKLRSQTVRQHGANNVVSADAATVLNDQGVECTFVGTEVTSQGALFDVVTGHNEAQGVIDAAGKRPRVSPYDETRLFIGYEDTTSQLAHAVWSPGSALSFTPSANTLRAERAWDQTGFEVTAEPAGVWGFVSTTSVSDLNIKILPETSAIFSFTRAVSSARTNDVAVSVRVLADGETIELTWATVGVSIMRDLHVGIELINMTTQVVTPVFQQLFNFTGTEEPIAVSVDSRDGVLAQAWVERPGPINRQVEVVDVTSGSATALKTFKRASLVSQLAPIGASTVGVISILPSSTSDPDADPATFVGGKGFRSGLIMLSATSDEVVGRIGVGEVEDLAERQLRVPKTGLNRTPEGELVLGWQETDLTVGTARSPLAVLYRWIPATTAHAPAVLSDILVSPHGGYPRMNDGLTLSEHDWHHTVEIPKVEIVAGSLPAGDYLVAVTYESFDATGKLYRSAAVFSGPHTSAGAESIRIFIRDLTVSERLETRFVFWRTLVGPGTEFFRVGDLPMSLFTAADDALPTDIGAITDAMLQTREVLDQSPTPPDPPGVIPSQPVAITDFTAYANARIWSRDPRFGDRVYHTISSRGGFGDQWNPTQFVVHNGRGEVNAVSDVNGRIALITALDGSAVYGDGPNELGAGTQYAAPAHLTLKIGTNSQSTVSVIPEGIAYGAGRGVPPQLLTGGWVPAPIAETVSAAYHRDLQTVVATAYVQETDTLHLLDDGPEGGTTRTFRFHFGSRTWARDTLRQGRDLTVLANGTMAILTVDGRVLVEQLDTYSSGGVGYVTRVRTSWLPASPGKPSTAGTFIAVHILGTREGSHGLRILVRYDYREEVVESAVVPASVIDANDADGEEYAYAYNTHGEGMRRAISVEIQDNGEPNETFAVEAVMVQSRVENQTLTKLPTDHQFNRET